MEEAGLVDGSNKHRKPGNVYLANRHLCNHSSNVSTYKIMYPPKYSFISNLESERGSWKAKLSSRCPDRPCFDDTMFKCFNFGRKYRLMLAFLVFSSGLGWFYWPALIQENDFRFVYRTFIIHVSGSVLYWRKTSGLLRSRTEFRLFIFLSFFKCLHPDVDVVMLLGQPLNLVSHMMDYRVN